jgi:hypothetical protein
VVTFIGVICGWVKIGVVNLYTLLWGILVLISGLWLGLVIAIIKENTKIAMNDKDSPIRERKVVFEQALGCKGNFLPASQPWFNMMI